MSEPTTNRKPHWMVAAWPGMGNVAVLAAGFLIQKLGMKPAGSLPPRGRFDVSAVEVRNGVVTSPRMPRNLLYQTEASGNGPRLTVFIGESQPNSGAYSFAQELMAKAQEMGVDRVITFASMASQLHPSELPRVFGAATHENLLDDLRKLEVQPLKEGQVGGLNGVLLGAAMERHLPGLCLMGEIPFFAAGVPNPKAAKAVLDAMSLLTGIEIDVEALNPHIEAIDRVLNNMLERMQSEQSSESPELEDEHDEPETHAARPPEGLDPAARQHIETLFAEARSDRSRAMALKKELDRLNVFAQYENRFLDLFRRAE